MMLLRCRQFEFAFPRPALLMGIVNVTPDSFADGGRYLAPDAAVAHGEQLVAEGADLLDIGGESTRPGAAPVAEAEELRRVLPVIQRLRQRVAVPISIDTRKAAVARAALETGASVVNDVEAGRTDDALWQAVAEFNAGYVCMHMQGTPATMQAAPIYANVVGEVGAFFSERLARLQQAGIEPAQVALDPGLGFGKTLEHNLQLLANLETLRKYERPLLVGASRKSFLGRLLGVEVDARLPGSLAAAAWAVHAGAVIVRTHDVAATRQVVRTIEALRSRK